MILPHPCPLPLEEGDGQANSLLHSYLLADSGAGFHQARQRILPLPAGEGRGEGES